MKKNWIKGATFFRPTMMSAAMSDAGVIPAPHMIKEPGTRLLVRNRNDNFNIRPSISLVF